MNNKLLYRSDYTNKVMKNSIIEQFSIDDLDFNDNRYEYDANIFNKEVLNSQEIFNKIIEGINPFDYEIDFLDTKVADVAVNSKQDMIKIINYYSKHYSEKSLNWLDVHNIRDMNGLFQKIEFNGDISQWDVSNVTCMNWMFEYSSFNNDIANWNTSSVTSMQAMFA